MAEDRGSSKYFTKEMIADAVRLWTRLSISLIDVRFQLIQPDTPIHKYTMPTSMLVYTYGHSANVKLDNAIYRSERFSLFHGGKGTELCIDPCGGCLEVYMVLYKAETPPFYRKELLRLLEQANPFTQLYGYSPENPIFFVDRLQTMHSCWQRESAINQFNAKVILYQLMHEIYKDLEKRGIQFLRTDIIASAKHYLDEQFTQPISIQAIADRLSISGSQLSRLFKRREQKSLQEYLNQKRLDAARAHLLITDATIKEIAAGCGFMDEINLIRMFKKYYKMTPSDYRKKNATDMRDCDIDNDSQRHYNDEGLAKLAKSTGDGEFWMFGQTKSKEMILAAALSLMLLLTACASNTPSNTSSPSPTSAQSHDQATPSAEAKGTEAAPQTRIVATKAGNVEIPADPKRIVVQSMFAVGDILPFGKSIVGIDKYFKEFSDLEVWEEHWNQYNKQGVWEKQWDQALGDVEFIALENVEGILALEPDLIIARMDGLDEKLIEQYQKIAPTLFYDARNMTMEESMDFMGDIFGMPERAEELKKAYAANIEKAKKRLTDAGLIDKKVVFIQGVEGKSPSIHGDKNRALVYDILGMHAPEIVESKYFSAKNAEAEGSGYSTSISLEVLPEYVSEADIIAYTFFDESAEAAKAKLAEVPLWAELPAVKNGNVYYYSVNDTMMNYDYASHLITLDTFVDGLLRLPIAKE
ncbi:AraC family transcriptional regulator [Cohnella boryungensis]|uniref:AraC family transcriptional regulator n=1 Tax=Cohnella boryungensis TaxID=768479 RepID=A0ABV8S8Q7_9BACL